LSVVKRNFDTDIKTKLFRRRILSDMTKKMDGKKFMWDQERYATEAEAKEKMANYEKDGFETRLIQEESKFLVYTRRVVTEIVLEEGGQPL
jgi:hypothetical protein